MQDKNGNELKVGDIVTVDQDGPMPAFTGEVQRIRDGEALVDDESNVAWARPAECEKVTG